MEEKNSIDTVSLLNQLKERRKKIELVFDKDSDTSEIAHVYINIGDVYWIRYGVFKNHLLLDLGKLRNNKNTDSYLKYIVRTSSSLSKNFLFNVDEVACFSSIKEVEKFINIEYDKLYTKIINSIFNVNLSNTLFCIVGETASGKDTMVENLIQKYDGKLKPVCSYTTRPKRDNELNGKEHYFVSKLEFDNLRSSNSDDIVAYTKISSDKNDVGYEYMALLDEVKKSNLYIIDPNGIKYLKEQFKDKLGKDIVIIYITAPLEDRLIRAKNRSDFKSEFKKRVLNESNQFIEFRIDESYDYIIDNKNGRQDIAFKELCEIIDKHI